MKPIYLDHNSTTPMLPEVAAAMAPWLGPQFGNPGSQHQFGRAARRAIEDARDQIGRILGAERSGRRDDRVILTSGGTEANNLALLGLAGLDDPHATPGEAIISAIEHPSVTGPAQFLARHGWTIHSLGVDDDGVVNLDQLDELLSRQTRFVSIMLANNETGVIQPVAEIARRCSSLGVPLHTDAVQAVGKVPVNFRVLGAASMSVAAHKFHGPLGVGALVVRGGVRLDPILFGGFQQDGLRPGTESVALAVGLCAALTAFEREGTSRTDRLRLLRDRLEIGLARELNDTFAVNGATAARMPQTSNVAFLGLDRQALLMALDLDGVACSTGSACASGSSEPSPVLTAMGVRPEVLQSSLRFSVGASTTEAEIDEAVGRITKACAKVAAALKARKSGSALPGIRP